MKQRICELLNLRLTPYLVGLELQRSLFVERINDPNLNDVLILLEHYPVYTLGQGASMDYLKFDPNSSQVPKLYRVERGGEVTYHCPGQLVGYPILNLKYYQADLHWYMRQLEEVIIQVLGKYGILGERVPRMTGVWIEGKKIAAIGIKVSRWITMHGFSLNVNPDLSGFDLIVPCGISKPITSLNQYITDINPEQVRQEIINVFSEIFEVKIIPSCYN